MTSEVMLMNLEAVAFAADSAVTRSGVTNRGDRHQSHASGVTKAFVLEQQGPVGAIIFGNAVFCKTPWAHVLRVFSEELKDTPDTLSDMGALLHRFLLSSEHGFVSKDDAERAFSTYVVLAAVQLVDMVKYLEQSGIASGADAANLALLILENDTIYRDEPADPKEPDKGPAKRSIIGKPTAQLAQFVADNLSKLVDRVLDTAYPGRPPPDLADRLKKVIEASLVTDWLPIDAPSTGLVLAGFGKRDRTPAFLHLDIYADIGGLLKHRVVETGQTSHNGDRYIARSFAIDGAVSAFVQGIHPRARRLLQENIGAVMAFSFNWILQKVKPQNQALAAELQEGMTAALRDGPRLAVELTALEHEAQVQALMGQLASLETDETLAERAGRFLQLVVLEHQLIGSRDVASPISILRMRKGRAALSTL